ncbi:MAG: sensor histidine kinase [Evtepia gabavorous]
MEASSISNWAIGDSNPDLPAYDISDYQTRQQWPTERFSLFFGAPLSYSIVFLPAPWTALPNRLRAAGDCPAAAGNPDELGALVGNLTPWLPARGQFCRPRPLWRTGPLIGEHHELKPRHSILGYADLLRRGTLSPEEQANAADYIFSEGKRLERLSLKLLELYLAEHQALSLVPAAPADLLQDLTAHLSPGLARQGIVLTTQWEPGLCLLEPDLFRSLVLNLIDNSRKAIGAQGTISISCQMTERGCRLTVQDTGRGMPPEVLSHLTEAFYRVDKSRARAQGGAGLGLALCEKIAVLHQGRITFESTLGQGTTVTVSLEGGRP